MENKGQVSEPIIGNGASNNSESNWFIPHNPEIASLCSQWQPGVNSKPRGHSSAWGRLKGTNRAGEFVHQFSNWVPMETRPYSNCPSGSSTFYFKRKSISACGSQEEDNPLNHREIGCHSLLMRLSEISGLPGQARQWQWKENSFKQSLKLFSPVCHSWALKRNTYDRSRNVRTWSPKVPMLAREESIKIISNVYFRTTSGLYSLNPLYIYFE